MPQIPSVAMREGNFPNPLAGGIYHPSRLVDLPHQQVHLPYDGVKREVLYPVQMHAGAPYRGFPGPQRQAAEVARQQQRQALYAIEQRQQQNSMPIVGGVSAELDYDIEAMSEFVGVHACRLALFAPRPTPAFRKFVSQILTSTRLPRSTILLGLLYLHYRMMIEASGKSRNKTLLSPEALYRHLTVALVLANKFLDDNTFTNKSWSEVTNIDIGQINQLEKDWLKSISWTLQLDELGMRDWRQWETTCFEFFSHHKVPCCSVTPDLLPCVNKHAPSTSNSWLSPPLTPRNNLYVPRGPSYAQSYSLGYEVLPNQSKKSWRDHHQQSRKAQAAYMNQAAEATASRSRSLHCYMAMQQEPPLVDIANYDTPSSYYSMPHQETPYLAASPWLDPPGQVLGEGWFSSQPPTSQFPVYPDRNCFCNDCNFRSAAVAC